MRHTLTEGVSKMDTPFFIFSSFDLMSRIATSFMNIALFQGGSELERPFFIPKGFCAGINTKILIVTCYLLLPLLCLPCKSYASPR